MFKLLAAGWAIPFILLVILCVFLAIAVFCCLRMYFLYGSSEKMKYSLKKVENARVKRQKALLAKKQAAQEKKSKYKDAIISENFAAIKRKYLIKAIIKSCICGISSGFFAVGLLLLIFKLQGILFGILYYILVGVVCALLCGGITFLLLRPTNKKVAQSVDEEYALNVRVQTSLVFSRNSGTVVEMQREDANEKLAALPKSKIRFSKVWQYILIAVVSVALICTAFFIPGKTVIGVTPGDDPDNPKVDFDEYTIKGVNTIIGNVKKSKLDDTSKDSIVAALEDFKEDLEAYKDRVEDVPVSRVEAVISQVDGIVAGATSYALLVNPLLVAKEDLLADLFIDGAESYKIFNVIDYEEVKTFYTQKYSATENAMASSLSELRESLQIGLADGLADKLNEISAAMTAALAASGISGEDPLFIATDEFAKALSDLADETENMSAGEEEDAAVQEAISDLFSECSTNLAVSMSDQAYYYAMDTYVSRSLKKLFGLPDDYEQGNDPSGPSGSGSQGGDDDGSGSGHGGGGTGDVMYGSDDEIYDPRTGEYRKYGDILNEYYAEVQQYLNQERSKLNTDSSLSEDEKKAKTEQLDELQRIVTAYFDALFSGIESAGD